jgi:hypothetical protein
VAPPFGVSLGPSACGAFTASPGRIAMSSQRIVITSGQQRSLVQSRKYRSNCTSISAEDRSWLIVKSPIR